MSFKRNEKLRALALSSRPQGESNRLVALLCEDGAVLRCVAHGVRKPGSRLAAALEPASLSMITVRRSRAHGLASLTEAELLNPFSRIKSRLEGLQAVFEFLSLLLSVSGYDSGDKALFTRALGLLEYVEHTPENSACFLPLARLLALRQLGRMPELSVCLRCRARPPERITPAGAFCAPCQEIVGGNSRAFPPELWEFMMEIGRGRIPQDGRIWPLLDEVLKWLLDTQDEWTQRKDNGRQDWTR